MLPWQAWAAFCDFYEGVQAVYTQIGYTSANEPALDNLWNFFLNVIHSSHHYTRDKSDDYPRWKSLEEWCREAEIAHE